MKKLVLPGTISLVALMTIGTATPEPAGACELECPGEVHTLSNATATLVEQAVEGDTPTAPEFSDGQLIFHQWGEPEVIRLDDGTTVFFTGATEGGE